MTHRVLRIPLDTLAKILKGEIKIEAPKDMEVIFIQTEQIVFDGKVAELRVASKTWPAILNPEQQSSEGSFNYLEQHQLKVLKK